jgi:death-on-curing protein
MSDARGGVRGEPRHEPRWLSRSIVLAIHANQIDQHGGSLGLRDAGLLESALERPRHRFHYDPEADLPVLAAAYGFGLAKNHAFIDGNKRIAFQAIFVFLGLNGLTIDAEEPAVVTLMLGVAAGDVSETELARWLQHHTKPR